MICFLSQSVKRFFEKEILRDENSRTDIFEKIMQIHGEIYRELEARRTQRIFILEEAFFLKQHFGVGWHEIFKNLSQGRLPILGAKNEWLAIQKLERLNINTLQIAAYGEEGHNPATKRSFLMTHSLPPAISLEDLSRNWKVQPPAFIFKKILLTSVATIARTLHTNGVNHRDFYICHFLLDNHKKMYLIDLHRAQIRKKVPLRWLIKDLAGLYFSSKDIGLTQRDLLRFIKIYRAKPLRSILTNEDSFWAKVKKRGNSLYQKQEKKRLEHTD